MSPPGVTSPVRMPVVDLPVVLSRPFLIDVGGAVPEEKVWKGWESLWREGLSEHREGEGRR